LLGGFGYLRVDNCNNANLGWLDCGLGRGVVASVQPQVDKYGDAPYPQCENGLGEIEKLP
jgi:hypothetical protein